MTTFDMAFREHIQLATLTKALVLLVFLAQFGETLYSVGLAEPPPLFELLYGLGFLWLICLWLRADSKRTGVTWPADLGMFLYVAWIFIIPYHLYKTRGFKGLLQMLSIIVLLFATQLIAALTLIFLGY